MSNRAWVTLATNDSYSLGALVLAHSLKRTSSEYPSVVLITPSVTDAMRERLSAVFAEVITVDVLDSRDAAHLALLQRPELGITFTKIHCWNLTQYEKCVFLDADTLVIQNCDELFEREELSAAPDVGWPDCFNSGVFVFKPSADTFSRLITFAQERGSFDGGDQGLLNSFFSDWAHGDINKHLPFLYNVTSAAFYSYIPALKHYGQNLKIIHFIGAAKPWLQQYNWESNSVDAPDHIRGLLQLWWDIFVGQVHTQLDTTMVEVEEEPQEAPPVLPPQDVLFHYAPKLDPESEFPWHHPESQIPKEESDNQLDLTNFYDPWEHYRGMPEVIHQNWDKNESTCESSHTGTNDERQSQNPGSNHWQHSYQHDSHKTHSHEQHTHYHTEQCNHHFSEHDRGNQEVQTHYTDYEHSHAHHPDHDHDDQHPSSQPQQSEPSSHHHLDSCSKDHDPFHEQLFGPYSTFLAHLKKTTPQYVYCVHLDHSKPRKQRQNKLQRVEITVTPEMMNGHNLSDDESDDFDDIIPRHPYDGFYLRHRVTVDSLGKKVCTHEIPPASSPPASPPPDRLNPSDSPELSLNEDNEANGDETSCSKVTDHQTGVAGNLARVQPGATSTQREAIDELSRRQGWEAGNIDYMGADSFDNIWAKISQTLNQPRTSPPRQSPPKQPSPPKEQPPQPAPEVQPTESKEPVAPAVEIAKKAEPVVAAPAAPSQETKTEASDSAASEAPKEENKGEVSPFVEVPPSVEAQVEVKSAEIAKVKSEAPGPIEAPAPKEAPASMEVPAPVEAPTTTEISAPVEVPEIAEVLATLAEVPSTPVKEVAPEAPESDIVPVPTESPKETPCVKETTAAEPKVAIETEAPSEPQPVEKVAEVVETPIAPKEDAKVESAAPQEAAEAKPKKTETPAVPPTPPVTPKSTPEACTPVSEAAPQLESPIEKAAEIAAAVVPKPVLEAEAKETAPAPALDSPPLANTPSKEEAPSVPAAKSEEKRRPAGKLRLSPPGAPDALPTPDSEMEDAAALAHAIIAGELRTPTVTSPSPPASSPASPPAAPAAPAAPAQNPALAPQQPQVPTPPVGAPPAAAVSLAQIGVKPKAKPTTADAIESSLSETKTATAPATEAPKKKVIKKVVKKESAAGGEAPVPPPRKKEKKPKEK